ncbi:MAG: adenylyl-sulfate kinase [Polyangiaceae bacterium]|nr:adenylyl-sulfate kinase [Polyangiaceae bacterium]
MTQGFIVWFTGLSGSGKSTLASILTEEIRRAGVHGECLDGDEVRKNLSWGLGFSREDRDRNVERIGYVARMVARTGSCAITAAISPYRSVRDGVRAQCENFIEVYCECPLEVLSERDPKGLYKRALAGEIKNFTGVDDPYEAPINPDIHLATDRESPQDCARKIIQYLQDAGFLQPSQSAKTTLTTPFGGEISDIPGGKVLLDGPSRELSRDEYVLTQALAGGFLSPMHGFMTRREARRVENGSRLECGLPWQTPILLSAPEDVAKQEVDDQVGERVQLSFSGHAVAELELHQLWQRTAESSPKLEQALDSDGERQDDAADAIAGGVGRIVREGYYWAVVLRKVAEGQAIRPNVREIRRQLIKWESRLPLALFLREASSSEEILKSLNLFLQVFDGIVLFGAPERIQSLEDQLLEMPVLPVPWPAEIPSDFDAVVAQNIGTAQLAVL